MRTIITVEEVSSVQFCPARVKMRVRYLTGILFFFFHIKETITFFLLLRFNKLIFRERTENPICIQLRPDLHLE